MSAAFDRNKALHVEKLDESFFKFAEGDYDDDLLWGVGRISDESVVIPPVFNLFERIWNDLYYAQDSLGHSFLVFDAFEILIDITEDFEKHCKRLKIDYSCEVCKISAKEFDDAYYYNNTPDLSSHKLIKLEATINNNTYVGCMQMRINERHQSVLIVPPIYDDILLSRHFVSARSPFSSDAVKWEFYEFYETKYKLETAWVSEHNRRFLSFGQISFYTSRNPVEGIPSNVYLLVYDSSSESICPYSDFTAEHCDYGYIFPIPYSDSGAYVWERSHFVCVDKVKEVLHGNSLIIMKDEKYGVRGSCYLHPVFSSISRFSKENHDVLCIEKFGKYGVFVINDERIISPVYDGIKCVPIDCYCSLSYDFIVRFGDKRGVLDQNGDVIVPILYNSIEAMYYKWDCENAGGDSVVYKIRQDNFYGVFGIIEPIYEDVKLFARSMGMHKSDIPYYGLKKASHWYLADQEGKLLSQEAYDSIDYSIVNDCFVYKKGEIVGSLTLTNQ